MPVPFWIMVQVTREEAKAQLVALYRAHNPEKLPIVDGMLDKYDGRFQLMLDKLYQKYPKEPSTSNTSLPLKQVNAI